MLRKTESRHVNLESIMEFYDKVTYNTIMKVLEDKEALVYLSEDNDFLAAQNQWKPMWVWIDKTSRKEKAECYISNFVSIIDSINVPNIIGDEEPINDIAEKLNRLNGYSHESQMGMIAYYCDKVNNPLNSLTKLERSSEKHIDVIARFIAGITRDVYGERLSIQDQLESAKQSISAGNLYILVKDSEVLSMANIAHRSQNFGRINLVYTPNKYRKNDYASELVAKLSQLVLDEDRIPMLYTDDSNATSNKIYKNIGYKKTGRVKNIKLNIRTTV